MLIPIFEKLTKPVSAISLSFFRIAFGLLMFLSICRFISKGWINEFYIQPKFFFPFIEAAWFQPLPGVGMYVVFTILLISSFFIFLGFFYRLAAISFFICFTYVELLDKSYYLNHYYLISLLSFLIIFLPLNCCNSLDVNYRKCGSKLFIPRWMLVVLRLQIGMVYFFAGIAKIKYDWLMLAQPLRIWLPANSDFPIIGPLLEQVWVAYAFSWAGMVFDISAPFLLLFKKTRVPAFILVVVFHTFTFFLFNIGMFPWIMMSMAMIFFSANTHSKILEFLFPFLITKNEIIKSENTLVLDFNSLKAATIFFIIYFCIQVFVPLRNISNPENMLWTERGYRFSWNVMLMEKNAFIEIFMKDVVTKKEWMVQLDSILTPQQMRMMSTQPDMILQFSRSIAQAHFNKTAHKAEVRAECFVSLNGRASKQLINPKVDLATAEYSNNDWIFNK